MLNYDIIYSIDSSNALSLWLYLKITCVNIFIVVSPNSDLFGIDNETGWVYVNGELEADFGSPEIYTLTIRVSVCVQTALHCLSADVFIGRRSARSN